MWSLSEITETELAAGGSEEEAAKPESEHIYVASKDSDVFHLPSCQWGKRISEANRIHFQTYQEEIDRNESVRTIARRKGEITGNTNFDLHWRACSPSYW